MCSQTRNYEFFISAGVRQPRQLIMLTSPTKQLTRCLWFVLSGFCVTILPQTNWTRTRHFTLSSLQQSHTDTGTQCKYASTYKALLTLGFSSAMVAAVCASSTAAAQSGAPLGVVCRGATQLHQIYRALLQSSVPEQWWSHYIHLSRVCSLICLHRETFL